MPPLKTSDIPAHRVEALNAGVAETTTLVECFVIDFARLAANAPGLPYSPASLARLESAKSDGITRRMALAGELLRRDHGLAGARTLLRHGSDTVRGWAAYAIGGDPGLDLAARLNEVRPAAEDAHFGVREWAWMAVRGAIAESPQEAIRVLAAWTQEPSSGLRRFASEATRPRGVWCPAIRLLIEQPELGLPVLEPLRGDGEKYVQDSVANWLNDASKSRPDWVRALVERWRRESPTPATERICQRALRTVEKGIGSGGKKQSGRSARRPAR